MTLADPSSGQSFYFAQRPDSASLIRLDYRRPFVGGGETLKGLAGTWELYTGFAIDKRVTLFISLPYTYYSIRQSAEIEGSIGNISLGSQFANRNRKTNIIVGMTIPTATGSKSEAEQTGITSDYYHLRKYAENWFTLFCNFSFRSDPARKGIFAFEIGPQFLLNFMTLIPEILLNYGFQGGVRLSRWNLVAELTGLMIVTEADPGASGRFMHNLILGPEYNLKNFTPGIYYNLYLTQGVTNVSVLGIKLDYTFRRKLPD